MGTTRPLEPLPFWATDVNYPAGGESWSATPTKVEPGSAKQQDGFVPEERPPAQYHNWLLGKQGDWVDYLADLQIMNWPAPPITLNTGNLGRGLAFNRLSYTWIAVGGEDEISVSQSGNFLTLTWSAITPTSSESNNLHWVAADTGGNVVAGGRDGAAGNGGRRIYYSADGGATFNQTGVLTGMSAGGYTDAGCNAVISGFSGFVATGFTGSVSIGIWTSTDGGANWTQQTVPSNTLAGTDMLIAASASRIVVVSWSSGAGANRLWHSTDGVNWTFAAAPGAVEATGLVYNADEALWMLCLTDGKIYVSTDGISWGSVVKDLPFPVKGLCAAGSLFITSRPSGMTYAKGMIAYSTDRGLNWRAVSVTDDPCTGSICYAQDDPAVSAGGGGSAGHFMGLFTTTFGTTTAFSMMSLRAGRRVAIP